MPIEKKFCLNGKDLPACMTEIFSWLISTLSWTKFQVCPSELSEFVTIILYQVENKHFLPYTVRNMLLNLVDVNSCEVDQNMQHKQG